MSGIQIPNDRTTKQRVRGYCLNAECSPRENERYEFDVEHDRFCCPKCGAYKPPMVGVLSLVHWLARDSKGPIEGTGGLRWKLACEADRAYLATFTNKEAASVAIEAVNCPGCLEAYEIGRRKAGNFFRGS